jgi:AcrR family transcriptional regulator
MREMSSLNPSPRRAALVVAHPGHELRVHRWLELTRPVVFVLTDGSGNHGVSRLASTTALLDRAGATPGSIYGRLSDRELYRAILGGDLDLFTSLADELAQGLAGVDIVAGDAVEGYNPGHDVCRLLLNAAVLHLAAEGRRIANFDFPLVGVPDDCPPGDRGEALRLELDEESLHRKLEAARTYPELAGEVEAALAAHGSDRFRVECLRPVRYGMDIAPLFSHPPFYETYGEKRVALGLYGQVIRYQSHLAPLAAGLESHVTEESRRACASC